jgi:hypothetical protein
VGVVLLATLAGGGWAMTTVLQTREAPAWAEAFFRDVLALGWHRRTDPCVWYSKIGDTMTVIVSGDTEADGKRWIHVSVSRPSRLPSWEDLREVKDTFIGRDRKAIQVLPPAAEYINLHSYALHLFHCLDGDPFPDFRRDGVL